jgi:hypothetical protein
LPSITKKVQWRGVCPTCSRSVTRKHFWTEVARVYSQPPRGRVELLELDHPRRGEEERGIVLGHDGRRRHHTVVAAGEEVEELAS